MYKNSRFRLPTAQLFVSETEFDRSMSRLARGAEGARTITFPDTVRDVSYDAFKGNLSLRSVVLNEGLERLREHESAARSRFGCPGQYAEAFSNSWLQRVTLPATLKALGNYVFRDCGCLRKIYVADGCEAGL